MAQNFIKITQDALDLAEIKDLVGTDDSGAITIFMGTTRNNMNGRPVVKLEYEAYESMALKEMHKLSDELRVKWPDVKNVAIYHRLGEVKIGEASIIIAISAPHRKDSLESVSYCIDKFKETVPIFKKVNRRS